jgi:RNA polymerase sigma-70 factor (ECF subfamily)
MHRGWVARVVRTHGPRDGQVEDLGQEVAVRFVRSIAELGEPEAFAGWLRTIAVNVARSAGRQRRQLPSAIEVDGEIPDVVLDTRRNDRERLDTALHVIDSLEPELREALLLKSLHEFSQNDIARALGVAVTTVESRLARARRALRNALAALDQDSQQRPARSAQG